MKKYVFASKADLPQIRRNSDEVSVIPGKEGPRVFEDGRITRSVDKDGIIFLDFM